MAQCLIHRVGGDGVDVDGATASEANVLSGETFGMKGRVNLATGTMTNNGAYNKSIGVNSQVTIPAGYHNGTGKITYPIQDMAGGTYTPKNTDTVIPCAKKYLTSAIICKGDTNLKPENILMGKTIFGVTGTFRDRNYNTAYNGSAFGPLFKNGVMTGADFYYYDYSLKNGGWNAATKKLYDRYEAGATENKIITSGTLTVNSNVFGAYDYINPEQVGFFTRDLVDLSYYNKIAVTFEYIGGAYNATKQVAPIHLHFTNQSLNQTIHRYKDDEYIISVLEGPTNAPTKATYTFNISDLNGSYYIGFTVRPSLSSGNNNELRYYEGKFTYIYFSK